MKHFRSLALASVLTAFFFGFSPASQASTTEDDPAIAAVIADAKVVAFMKKYSGDDFEQQLESMTLRNGSCGFAGCSWSRLVSVTITRLVSNSPSTTIHALVSGTSPGIGPATVEFVDLDLKPMSESRWNWEAGN